MFARWSMFSQPENVEAYQESKVIPDLGVFCQAPSLGCAKKGKPSAGAMCHPFRMEGVDHEGVENLQKQEKKPNWLA